MLVKELARRAYHLLPDGTLRRSLTALFYQWFHAAQVQSCTWRDGRFVVVTRDGVKVRTEADFDPECLLSLMQEMPLPTGAVVLDLGGNVGATTIYLAKHLGVNGRLVVFEPDPANAAALRRNLALNDGMQNVLVVEKGVREKEGEVDFLSTGGYTSSFLQTDQLTASRQLPQTVRVPVTTVDATVRSLGLGRLDFVKMDIEGSEVAALQGAEETLRRFRPRLLVEPHTVKGVATTDTVVELLNSYGYRTRVEACGGGSVVLASIG